MCAVSHPSLFVPASDPATLHVQDFDFRPSGFPFVLVDTPGLSDVFNMSSEAILRPLLRGEHIPFDKKTMDGWKPIQPPIGENRHRWINRSADLVMFFISQEAADSGSAQSRGPFSVLCCPLHMLISAVSSLLWLQARSSSTMLVSLACRRSSASR